jgi:predicted DNA-binding protein (UPF0251 family)
MSADFVSLFDQHVAFVWRVLLRHEVPERALEGACTEVFVSLHGRLPELAGRRSLRPWLYGVARDVAQRMPHEPGGSDQALRALSQEEREAFALSELELMTMAEASAALGVSEETVLARRDAAREKLRATSRPGASANVTAEPSAAQRSRMLAAIGVATTPSLAADLGKTLFRRHRTHPAGWAAIVVAFLVISLSWSVRDCNRSEPRHAHHTEAR